MKPKTNRYAKALVSVLGEAKQINEKALSQGFLKLLEKNGDLRKAKEIVTLAERLWLEKTGKNSILIESARKMEKKTLPQLFLKKGDFVRERIDADLVAGMKITINGEKQLDVSLKKKMQDIFGSR